MTEQVEGDVAERDVFFELGGVRDPLAEAVREHERVVSEPQRVEGDGLGRHRLLGRDRLGEGFGGEGGGGGPARLGDHRCGTASDAV